MAFITAGDGVLANERKVCDVVVKAKFVSERGFVVTLFTLLTELACVDIFTAVASDTGSVGCVFQFTFVTAATGGFGVFSFEREVGFFVVIERDLAPFLTVVAVITAFAIPPVVTVIVFVTTHAGFGRCFVVNRVFMTAVTGHISVRTFKFEVRIFVVVETVFIPGFSRVAVFALVTAAAAVSVIHQMTAHTEG